MLLLIAIVLSVLVVMCESVDSIGVPHQSLLEGAEWLLTVLFTLEYVARIICARCPFMYAASFYGVVDLLAILPTYVTLLPAFGVAAGTQRLAVIRARALIIEH